MLAEHGPEVEADLLETFGVDILDLGTERLTWGRLARLLEALPPNARTRVAVRGFMAYGPTEHVLAAMGDILLHANWQRAQVNSKRSVPDPKPFPRPGPSVAPANRTSLTPAEIHRRLVAQRSAP